MAAEEWGWKMPSDLGPQQPGWLQIILCLKSTFKCCWWLWARTAIILRHHLLGWRDRLDCVWTFNHFNLSKQWHWIPRLQDAEYTFTVVVKGVALHICGSIQIQVYKYRTTQVYIYSWWGALHICGSHLQTMTLSRQMPRQKGPQWGWILRQNKSSLP